MSLHNIYKKEKLAEVKMAANLLEMANYLSSTLKEDKLASQGRGNDTKLEYVDGELAHVEEGEKEAIERFGLLGEAWVKSVGSGTINPNTGLKEYGTWRPSQGRWGIFGSTAKSKKRDLDADSMKARRNQFETFLSENKDTDFAGWDRQTVKDYTVDPDGGGGSMATHKGFFNLKNITGDGTNYINAAISPKDFDKYVDKYDSRLELEAMDNYQRKDTEIGNTSAVAEFGNLTASTQLAANQNFA